MSTTDAITPTVQAPSAAAPSAGTFQPFGEDGFTFFDFLDIVNPLQHLPVISTLYREITGDHIDPGSRVVGGTLFGGALGAASAMVNSLVETESGKDIGGHVLAALGWGDEEAPAMVADAASAEPFVVGAGPVFPAAENWPSEGLMPGPVTETALADIGTPSLETSGSEAVEMAEMWTPVVDPGAVSAIEAMLRPEGTESGQIVRAAMKRAEDTNDDARADSRNSPATAPSGGWFSDVMLSALRKYEAVQESDPSTVPAHTESRDI